MAKIDSQAKRLRIRRHTELGKGWSTSSHFLHLMMYSSSFLFLFALLSISKEGYAFESRKLAEESHTHTIQLASLFPPKTCKPSARVVVSKGASLNVVHKNGPRSQLINQERQNAPPTVDEILRQDEARVNALHTRYSKISGGGNDVMVTESTTIPAKYGSTVGTGNYVVTVGLGSPKKDLTLIFDTGSDLTWTQCQPCNGHCYKQKEPTFDPTRSSTYTNISCNSTLCNSLVSATGITPRCSHARCAYGIQYEDSSISGGFFGSERLTISPTDYFDSFYFGCGVNNRGLFGGSAGLLGLGRDKLSFVSQTAAKYNKLFSYCLPSSACSNGFLNFGSSNSNTAKFTPLSASSANSSFYGLDFTAISVADEKLSISASTFSTAGAIIDSGTIITRLPPAAYSALKSAFRKGMSMYPRAPALDILDTCYDLSKFKTVTVPKISFFFSGGVEVDVDVTGIFYVNKPTQMCLAVAGNSDPTDIAIFGNVQQQTFEVVYDVAGGKVGFAKGGCS